MLKRTTATQKNISWNTKDTKDDFSKTNLTDFKNDEVLRQTLKTLYRKNSVH